MSNSDYLELLKRARAALPPAQERQRIEIPKPIINQSGKQTIIKNFSEIAKAFRREPRHIAKYLFKELAVPGEATTELTLFGKISYDMISRRLDDYYKEFVLCNECKKPDTDIIKQDTISILKCQACGAKRPVRTI